MKQPNIKKKRLKLSHYTNLKSLCSILKLENLDFLELMVIVLMIFKKGN